MNNHLFPLIFLTLLLLAGARLTAQISDQKLSMSRGYQDALVMELPGADDKLVEDLWEDWLKDNYRVKTSRTPKTRTGELSSLNFGIPGINAGGKVDMYSMIEEVSNGSELTVWIATPAGYVSPELDAQQYQQAEELLQSFAQTVDREQIGMEIENQEELLEDLEKELERLQKDKSKAEKEIADARELIIEKETKIEQNTVDQESKQREIEAQIQVVEDTKRRLKDF
jgi:hypothetical protein